jgi:hypothetical protein
MFCNTHITTAACYCWISIIIIIIHNRFFSMCIITISILEFTYNLHTLLTRGRRPDAPFLVDVFNGFKCRHSLLEAIGIRVPVRSFRDYPLIVLHEKGCYFDGVRRSLWPAATGVPTVHPPDDTWLWRAVVDIILTGETEDGGERPVPVLLCPPQVPHGPGGKPESRGERTTNRLSHAKVKVN